MARQQSLEVAQNATVERLTVAAVSKVVVLAPPWVVLVLLMIVGAVSHAKWGAPPAVTWAAMAGTLSSIVLASLTWLISHQRGLIGRAHSALSTGAGVLWFTVATITGVWSPVTLGLWFFGGGTVALFWNIRAVIRQTAPGEARHADPLGWVFDQAKESFGLKGATVHTTDVDDHAIKGKLELPPGEKTADDALKKAAYIESGLRFPPNSVVLAPDEDDASQTHFTVSDPRIMKRPLPWVGPYRPGGSIAEPLRIGMYQDMAAVLHTFTGHYLQIMGMIGSGKSIGGCWNYLGEIITRYDAATFAIDLSKDDQTLGPLRPALHRFETTKAGAVDMIRKMHAAIPKRTAWLSEHGYQKWVKDCGLAYWFLWVEEFPKLDAALGTSDKEKFTEIVKEIRSAGGGVVLSYQRSDYTQGPTVVRGQLGKMCFGVGDSDDSGFGLSERQKDAGAAPELWGNHQPGMAFLDVPGIPETHYAMPLRTFSWGKTDQEASAAMRAHAAAWPATGKTVDEFTAALADPSGSAARPGKAIPMPAAALEDIDSEEDDGEDDIGDAVAEYQLDEDPDPTITAGPDDEITDPTDAEDRFVIPPPRGEKLSPQAARGLVHSWVRHRADAGRATFTAGDPELIKVKEATGMQSRGWLYKVLGELVDCGALADDDSEATVTYTVLDVDQLDDIGALV